jgi:hypothetical protein
VQTPSPPTPAPAARVTPAPPTPQPTTTPSPSPSPSLANPTFSQRPLPTRPPPLTVVDADSAHVDQSQHSLVALTLAAFGAAVVGAGFVWSVCRYKNKKAMAWDKEGQ